MNLNKIITLSDGKKIAEFKQDYYSYIYNFQTSQYDQVNTFRLDAENLKIRIANLKKYNIDSSVEESALFLLEE